MTRKIIKIGTSEGVTIPKEIMKKFNLKKGDKLNVVENEKKRTIEFKIPDDEDKESDKELLNWTDEFIEEYEEALNELAK